MISYLILFYIIFQKSNLRYAGYTAGFARAFRYLAFTSDFGEALRPVISKGIVTGKYLRTCLCVCVCLCDVCECVYVRSVYVYIYMYVRVTVGNCNG